MFPAFWWILHVYRGWRWPIGLRSNQAFFLRRMFYPGGSDGYGQQLRPSRVWAEGLGTCAEMDMFLFTLFTLCYETVFAGKSPFINGVNIKHPFIYIYKKLHFHEFPIAMFDRRIVFWLNFRIIELGSTGITKSNQLGGNMTGQSASLVFKTGPRKFDHQKASSQAIPKQKKNTSSQALIPGWRWRESPIHVLSCFICTPHVPKILIREKIWPGQGKVLQRLLPRLAKRALAPLRAQGRCRPRRRAAQADAALPAP